MKFIDRIMPRDIIAFVVLLGCGFLLYKGIDSFVTAITALIIGYYFSKRVYEERNGYVNQGTFTVKPRGNISKVPERILKSGERKQDFRSR